MGKYVIKRIGYMLVVALVLSILMFLLYNLLPANRAYTDAKADMQAMKNTLRGKTEEQKQEIFNERYHEYQKRIKELLKSRILIAHHDKRRDVPVHQR